jgi:hypothetical protein
MTRDDSKRLAAEQRLDKLTERHLEQLATSVSNNVALVARLPKDLHWSEESALVFRLPVPEELKR